MSRRVKGFLFVDYVRMLRARKNVDWGVYLSEEDRPYLEQKIELGKWYPMETFERMGIAILEEIAARQLDLVRYWGRRTIDGLREAQPLLFEQGDPCDTLMRFEVLRRSLFDYEVARIAAIRPGEARIAVQYGMSRQAEEAACHQSIGFFERLLEIVGAEEIAVSIREASWEGFEETVLAVRWRTGARSGPVSSSNRSVLTGA